MIEIDRGGRNIIELEVEEWAGEISTANNTAVFETEGIRENLRVLLVSGEPHAGERTWRNILKSDAAVDLVHFTILRPPEKQDGTPITQLSLIAFPTRELFQEKIDEFDLIIFRPLPAAWRSAHALFRQHRPLCPRWRRICWSRRAGLCTSRQPASDRADLGSAGRPHRPCDRRSVPPAADQ
jgi:hypothetical protein